MYKKTIFEDVPNQSVQFSQIDPNPAAQIKTDLFRSGSETVPVTSACWYLPTFAEVTFQKFATKIFSAFSGLAPGKRRPKWSLTDVGPPWTVTRMIDFFWWIWIWDAACRRSLPVICKTLPGANVKALISGGDLHFVTFFVVIFLFSLSWYKFFGPLKLGNYRGSKNCFSLLFFRCVKCQTTNLTRFVSK